MGVAYHDGGRHIVLKSDASLLNGRKPFFSPEGMCEAAVHPCLVFRIGRMGKHIEPRFAMRYIDGLAAGLHIEDPQGLETARKQGRDWTLATAMDGSMAVGEMATVDEPRDEWKAVFKLYGSVSEIAAGHVRDERTLLLRDKPEEVVAEISRTITLRQGDLIFVGTGTAPWLCTENNCISGVLPTGEEVFCKIK